MIPYGRQSISEDDIAAVEQVLRSDFLTQGPAVPAFEKALADYCEVPHVVAVNSATSALHIACVAMDLGPGDVLWTVPNTFVASANCGLYCGARIDFVDIDPKTYNLNPERLAEKLESTPAESRPKIVVAVHFSGQPCRMRELSELARIYDFRLIEDASHAVGARYQGEPVGNGRWSDCTVFSFHPVKIVTTAEGGVVTTRNEKLAARMRRLRSHGITREPDEMEGAPDGPWCYEQVELGWNYRMTDLQGALGRSQLTRLDEFVTRRRELAARYDELLADLPLQLPSQDADGLSAWHLYVVQLESAPRKAVFERLRAAGIGVNVHYIPVHLQPHYRRMGFSQGDFPVAEQYYSRALSLPLFPALSEIQQDAVVVALKDALGDR